MKSSFAKFLLFTVAVVLVAGGFWLQGTIDAQSREMRILAPIDGGSLAPGAVTKYVSPLVKPPVVRRAGKINYRAMKNAEYYEIAVRQFRQQILPPGLPMTTVWSYGPAAATTYNVANGFFYPAFTIEAKWKKPVVVKWVNGLVDASGNPLPHLLPVDPSLHWANPIGRRDTRPNPTDDSSYWMDGMANGFIQSDGNYVGPIPMVTHVHGAHTTEESDGYAEAWYLPASAYGLSGLNWATGTIYDQFVTDYGLNWDPGTATFAYPNDQRATTLWYHDHTLGMTRVNVYAGPAGFYLIRGGPDDEVLDTQTGTAAVLPGPAPGPGIDPFGTFYEIPVAIQDRSFNNDGSLFYPDKRAFFEGLDPDQLQIPFIYDQLGINPDAGGWGLGCDGDVSDVAPIWQPEFFGNMMVVNGQTWPFLDVEARRYRFRLLNGCNSRFLILDFSTVPGVEVWQIGAEGGFLPAPVNISALNANQLLMAPAERADVIVDFTNVPTGNYVLGNLGPDEPFKGFNPDGTLADGEGGALPPADPGSTGQVMLFRVGPAMGPDPSTPPQFLQLPVITPLAATNTRQVSLNEEESRNIRIEEDEDGNLVYDCTGDVFGPTAALLGTLNPDGTGNPLLWSDAITENPVVNTTEVWEIYNFTADAHPIHIHLVQFQVVDRQIMGGAVRGPEAWETGFKDTVIAYPGEITRVKMRFDIAGLYVWHCHIVEHEDNEMMRPYRVIK